MPFKLEIASCLGFCGGVKRAVQSFARLRAETPAGEAIYILHELVHNRSVTNAMKKEGAVFIEASEELPSGATCLIGAHGVGPAVEADLRKRAGRLMDATCPIVKKVQCAAASLAPDEALVLFGVRGHPEAEGVFAHAKTPHRFLVESAAEIQNLPELSKPVLLCQTTLDYRLAGNVFAALKARFPNAARREGSVCHASSERQAAVETLVRSVDVLLVIGSPHSSNANRLREIGLRAGLPSYLVDEPADLPRELATGRRIGIAAGASTPDEQIENVLAVLRGML